MKIKLPSQKNFKEKQKAFPNNQVNFLIKERTNGNKKFFSQAEKNRIVIEGQSGNSDIGEICIREGITPQTFYDWTQEFLEVNVENNSAIVNPPKKRTDGDKFSIVLEGKSGETSIPEICRRENITQDIFLQWSREFLEIRKLKSKESGLKKSFFFRNKLLIEKFSNTEVFHYLENFIDFSKEKQLIISDENSIKLEKTDDIESVICLKKVNDIRYINKYFERVNAVLPKNGIFVGVLETFSARKNRKNINKIPVVRDIYFFSEFILKRIIPKLSFTKGIYFDITKGNDRLLSKAEGLGRLVSSGFKIMDYKSINGLIYFVVKKEKEPSYDKNPSYGPLYKMPRIGKNGKIIKVYKLRTMHPYSEYLQDYVLKTNGYAETGKPADDFRIPAWGKFIRRFWLDEIPQLINVIKGEMKLVGIRPVSKRYFQDIPTQMQKLRLTQKPGCIPPYVALNRDGNVMSVLQAEKDYLEEKIKDPYFTDTKYFFKAIFNILFKHKRSA